MANRPLDFGLGEVVLARTGHTPESASAPRSGYLAMGVDAGELAGVGVLAGDHVDIDIAVSVEVGAEG